MDTSRLKIGYCLLLSGVSESRLIKEEIKGGDGECDERLWLSGRLKTCPEGGEYDIDSKDKWEY